NLTDGKIGSVDELAPAQRAIRRVIAGKFEACGPRLDRQCRGGELANEGCGIVIRMSAFVSMRQQNLRPPVLNQPRQFPSAFDELAPQPLVSSPHRESAGANTSGGERGLQLAAARRRIGRCIVETVPVRIDQVPWRSIGEMQQRQVCAAMKLRAEANGLVVWMRSDQRSE